MARAVVDKPFAHRVRLTEDGIHLSGSILSFDAQESGQLSFLSSAQTTPRAKGPRLIASEETVKILQKTATPGAASRESMLGTQYNRPFSLGMLKLELLPSGTVLGGTSLHVETEKGKLFYVPALQVNRIDTVRQYQVKKASTLVLGAFHPNPDQALPQRKREKERLLEAVERSIAAGQWPVIACEPLGTGQEITKMLTERGWNVSAHPAIYRYNVAYSSCGVTLGKFYRYYGGRPRQKILLLPLPSRRRRLTTTPKIHGLPTFYVEDSNKISSELVAFHEVSDRFVMSTTSDGPELKAFVEAVGAKEVYLFGPYVKKYIEAWKSLPVKIKPLFPHNQPALF